MEQNPNSPEDETLNIQEYVSKRDEAERERMYRDMVERASQRCSLYRGDGSCFRDHPTGSYCNDGTYVDKDCSKKETKALERLLKDLYPNGVVKRGD